MSVNRYQKLMLALVAVVGGAAINVNASTGPTISVSVANQSKIQQVMTIANQFGYDYTIRPSTTEDGHLNTDVVEISLKDQIQFAYLRSMVAN